MNSIKTSFGKAFKAARNRRQLSRAALAGRLGVSPKTIQSWEMGRTFVEKLDIIPIIEKELDISFTSLMEKGEAQQKAAKVEKVDQQDEWISIPLYTASTYSEDAKTNKTVFAPRSWFPHGGGIPVAFKLTDSSMSPLIKPGGIVIVDKKRNVAKRLLEHMVAIQPSEGKLRIRHLSLDTMTDKIIAKPAMPERRGRFEYSPENGDIIIGKVVGILGQPL